MALKPIEFPGTTLKDIPAGLRKIAEEIEKGEIEAKSITLSTGDDLFHLGDVSNELAKKNAVFNLQSGMHNLMKAIWK